MSLFSSKKTVEEAKKQAPSFLMLTQGHIDGIF